MNGMFDMGELVRRAIKYLVEGFMVAIAAFAIPQKQLKDLALVLILLGSQLKLSLKKDFIKKIK